MEGCRQLDAARCTSGRGWFFGSIACIVFFIFLPSLLLAQSAPTCPDVATVQKLADQQRWDEIVRESTTLRGCSADIDFLYGTALAQLSRWDEARSAFLEGRRLQTSDKRFPAELAGVAFKQKRYHEAAAWLHRARRLDPKDSYINDFLGTLYFVEDNSEAALKYWNHAGKPRVENVQIDPPVRIKPALLDRAFAFAPASTLRLEDLLTTEEHVRGLAVFPSFSLALVARDDGAFDVNFRSQERNGFGDSKWEALLSTFAGVFYQTAYPSYYNIGYSAWNAESLLRWDDQKRRALVSISGPLRQDPRFRFYATTDLRNENWDIRSSFKGPAPLLGALNLRREAEEIGFTSFNSGRWGWSTSVELSNRDYRSVFAGSALAPGLLLQGVQLKYLAGAHYELLHLPERRFILSSALFSQTGSIWSHPAHSFEKVQASATAHWFPQMRGDDYEMRGKVRAGTTAGQAPFDELFMLGLERDNDLWMRAHIGTRGGRKGSAPLGRNYFLLNWETDKNVFSNGFFGVKLGPFADTGRVGGSSPELAAREWLIDTGAQAKFRVLGVGAIFTYGKDLRSGNNAFYVTVGR